MSDPSAVHPALFSRSLCCNVRTATVAFTVYYLVSSLLVCVDMAVWVFNGKDMCGFIHSEHLTHGQQMFDTTSNFLLLVVMMISCIFVLVGLRKGCSHQLVPFIVQLYLDVALSVMSLFSGPWGLPGTPTYEESEKLVLYFTGEKELGERDMARFTLIFGVLFVLYLLVKVYMAHIVTQCYYVVKMAAEAKESQGVDKGVLVELPSYDEALKLPSKDEPPAYQLP
ncbi:mtp family protein [Megalops cyprinoides]|uniref:mtp family protein n=1 Tax=Megalops cyprinoides TaxID=118141 RepID=UPI001864A68E|nr:mtp family protein [Megalops cyprinoides]